MLSLFREFHRSTSLTANSRLFRLSHFVDGAKSEEPIQIVIEPKLEYINGAPQLNTKAFEELCAIKTNDLAKMIGYVETGQSRMKYLCDYLGDATSTKFNNCDNTGLKKIKVTVLPEWAQKLQDFREDYFPVLEVETKNTKLANEVAASYYGVSQVGSALHRSKYENGGDFPDFLLSLLLKAYRKTFGQEKFDLIVYVPPTKSGNICLI